MATGKDALDQTDTYTLPISESTFWFAVFVTSVFIATLVAILILPDNKTPRPQGPWRKFQDRLGLALWPQWIVFYTLIIWSVLFFALLGSIFFIIWTVLEHFMGIEIAAGGDFRWSLLTITALTAALSATVALPFTLLRSNFTRRQTEATEQGLITDRINAAVASLGTERAIQRIGRPVTILTGKQKTTTHLVAEPDKFVLPPRSEEKRRYRDSTALPPGSGEDYFDGIHIEVVSWSAERTLIEWQNEPVAIADDERIDSLGNWEVFSETLPNMEVRIGAIYALERIARETPNFHVQIMEILCAYIRENSPAENAEPLHMPEMPADDVENPRQAWKRWQEGYEDDSGAWHDGLDQALADLKSRIRPRTDIQTALEILGRREKHQRKREAGWPDPNKDGAFVFDAEFPAAPVYPDTYTAEAHKEWVDRFDAFHSEAQNMLRSYEAFRGYRLDLRATNLQGYDLQRLHLNGARFEGAQMQRASLGGAQMMGATLWGARMMGANLRGAQMMGANLWNAQMQGAELRSAQMQRAILVNAQMQHAHLWNAKMQGAFLGQAKMQGAELWDAQMQGTDLANAQMQGADLWVAKMHEADLTNAQMQGVNLRDAQIFRADLQGAQLSEETSLTATTVRGIAVREVLKVTISQLYPFWPEVFADGTVPVPPEDRPAHWPAFEMESDQFHTEWRKWQADPEGYTPPDPPED